MMRRALPILLLVVSLLALSACSLPSWLGGPKAPIKRAPGERHDVILGQGETKPDASAQDVAIEVPEPAALAEWPSRNAAMLTSHIAMSGVEHHQEAQVGGGHSFSQPFAPQPIVVGGLVIAMDAAGIISAHDASDIEKVRWVNRHGAERSTNDILGGGLGTHNGVVFAATGFGKLFAIDARTGTTLWKTTVGAPVRGAPAAGSGIVAVVTADDQTLAFDEAKGTPRWSHRGMREQAGYFSRTGPVITDDGIVVSAYTSGEIFALRAESGSALWSDTVGASDKTLASDIFNGIDADPIVQDGVVVVTSAAGTMQASALLNGKPLWQGHVGSHQTPWSAGNALFAITTQHEVVAVLKRDGTVRWADSLAEADIQGKDITPPLFGPALAANGVIVVSGDGLLMSFRPQDGSHLADTKIADHVLTAPVLAGGSLYLVTKDATLYRYY